MTVQLIELLLGIYFIGVSIGITKSGNAYSKTVDLFKLLLGVLLIILALLQGVRFI